ncbi:hypothetical protein BTA51_29445 [Hahella sp. CCB-MM4]|uniref:sensor histidine kinase n=1 Tax=Hahella sp. (strain CCB-MM4) TaxID=1926491 RepID=UPI000B9C2CC9|nr:HAMP domain-containing sensor histidine kinase [Hahella sp. CCB-MM4]OZG69750.1 hypothetical protein BTA51_29445 [Hahella sp. CCB-MM4]
MAEVRVKSLSEQLRWQLIVIGLALFVVFSALLTFYSFQSMENAGDSWIRMEARSLIKQLELNSQTPLPDSRTMQAYRSWQEIPESLRRHFDQENLVSGEVYEVSIEDRPGKEEILFLLYHNAPSVGELYILSQYDADLIDGLLEDISTTVIKQSLMLTGGMMLILFVLVFWLLKRTSEPMRLLSQWAEKLRQEEHADRVSFPIAELNTLAGQLREGVDKITEYNRREQQFLKHASHELRTPLATIQACLDTLNFQIKGPETKTIDRALKASMDMSRLTTALLWLARDSDRPIAREPFEIESFTVRMVNEHQHLIVGRQLHIDYQVHCEELNIEKDLFAIVFANLLRNACQHSSTGTIFLQIYADHLTISNPVSQEVSQESYADYSSETGFGLGLQLVERICRKLGWEFRYQRAPHQVTASIFWRT